MWGPQDSVQLVNITPITMVYGTQITIVFMGFINQFMTGGPHIVPIIKTLVTITYLKDPWCWNIYLLIGIILIYINEVNVGKYSIHGSSGI